MKFSAEAEHLLPFFLINRTCQENSASSISTVFRLEGKKNEEK
jgi:hypothetical protein